MGEQGPIAEIHTYTFGSRLLEMGVFSNLQEGFDHE